MQDDRELLEVEFVDYPEWPITPGVPAFARVFLLSYPELSYRRMIRGAKFEILDGDRVIGTGLVVGR